MSAAATAAAAAPVAGEAALAELWASAPPGPLRLEDGRSLRIVFPGVPGGGAGPDFRGAMLDAGGDFLRGDVEIHLRASGWRDHGHAADPAYGQVVLHVVAENDTGAVATLHGNGRAIPILVLRQGQAPFPPPFTPPCALAAGRGTDVARVLARMGLRRLRARTARAQLLVTGWGPGQALYTMLIEMLGGPANRGPFGQVARQLPLAALLERADGPGASRPLAIAAELKGVARLLTLRRAGLRPMAAPARRLEAAGALVARLWPAGAEPGWPHQLEPTNLLRILRTEGVGRSLAVELAVNAVLPVALASGAWPEPAVESAYAALPSPGTYGKLRRLEGWLATGEQKPFRSAQALQGGLLLHGDYCMRGACGRCPLSG